MDGTTWKQQRKQLSFEISRLEQKSAVLRDDAIIKETNELLRHRKSSFEQTKRFLSRFKTDLKFIEDTLGGNIGNGCGTEDIQSLLETFERKLMNYKMCMREEFENLVCEEKILDKELSAFIEEYDGFNQEDQELKKRDEARTGINARLTRELDRQSKIGAIDKQIVAMGNKNGTWDPRDHDLFLKVLTQNSINILKLQNISYRRTTIKKLLIAFPGKNEDEMSDHLDFYAKYTKLIEEKKQVLQTWRNEQNERKKKIYDSNIAVDSEHVVGVGCESFKSKTSSIDNRIDVKKQIAEWKKLQSENQEQMRAEETERKRKEKLIESEERARRQASMRMKLDQWREMKGRKAENVEDEGDVNTKVNVDPAELQRMRERDLEFEARRNKKIAERKNIDHARENRLKESKSRTLDHAKRDPNRLLRATAASTANQLSDIAIDDANHRRANASAHSTSIAMGGYDLKFSGRAKASWAPKGLL